MNKSYLMRMFEPDPPAEPTAFSTALAELNNTCWHPPTEVARLMAIPDFKNHTLQLAWAFAQQELAVTPPKHGKI